MKRTTFALAAALAAISVLPACAGSTGGGPQVAKVTPGTLPTGETFKGVWYNRVFGDLHLVPEGNHVNGKYKSPQSGVWGKVTGTITGDVIKFEWVEHKTGAIGPGSTKSGKGYWKFVPGEAPAPAALKGEWGLGDNEVGGGEWDCIRQKDVEPKLDSVGNDAAPTDGAWDKETAPPPDKKK